MGDPITVTTGLIREPQKSELEKETGWNDVF